jgi:hypothetical protein
MGSSFTEFRGKGFWSRDALLKAWLRILSLHMEDEVYKPGWQHDLRDKWLLASAGYFNGCISPALDDFLTERPHRYRARILIRVIDDHGRAAERDVQVQFVR